MSDFKNLIKGIFVFLLYILVPMLLPSMTSSNENGLLLNCMFMFLLLLFYVFIYKEDIIKDIKALKNKFLSILGKSLIYFVVLIVGFGVISGILLTIFPDFVYTNSSIIDSLLKENFLLMIFYVFIISLFIEQIVFRKVFKDIIKNKYFFVLFSGIIYGIFQIGYNISGINDICTMIPFIFAGCVLSYSYLKTDNIFTPCLVYLFYDLFLLIGSIL